jgi:hypothetical protein
LTKITAPLGELKINNGAIITVNYPVLIGKPPTARDMLSLSPTSQRRETSTTG